MELFTANRLSTDNKHLDLSKLVIEEKSSVKKNTESNLALVNHGTFPHFKLKIIQTLVINYDKKRHPDLRPYLCFS